VGITVAIGAGVWLAFSAAHDGQEAPTTDLGTAAGDALAHGTWRGEDGRRAWLADGVSAIPADAVVIIDFNFAGQAGQHAIWLFEPSGSPLAVIEAGAYPAVLYRPEAGELIVSDVSFPASGGFAAGHHARAVAYDLNDRLQRRWEVALPGRTDYTLPVRMLALTADERYLVYTTTRFKDTDACRATDVHGPSCALHGVGYVDLEGPAPVARSLDLPVGCQGAAPPQPSGRGGVLLACHGSGDVLRLDAPAGAFALVADARGWPELRTDLVAAYDLGDGAIGLLLDGGGYSVVRDGAIVERLELLGDAERVVPLGQQDVVDGQLLVPFQTNPQHAPAGALLFDLPTRTVVWRFEGSDVALTGAPTGSGEARLITPDGRVLAIGREAPPAALFADLPWAPTQWMIVR
jgi:hypothetical protein